MAANAMQWLAALAFIAVPLAACLNGVVRHLAEDAKEFQADPEDPAPLGGA